VPALGTHPTGSAAPILLAAAFSCGWNASIIGRLVSQGRLGKSGALELDPTLPGERRQALEHVYAR